jgi:hypothetical protein
MLEVSKSREDGATSEVLGMASGFGCVFCDDAGRRSVRCLHMPVQAPPDIDFDIELHKQEMIENAGFTR